MNIPLNIDWQQILLHLLNFVILAGGLYLLLYKPVKAFMDKRTAYYRDQDAQAAKALADAEQTAAGLGACRANAQQDAALPYTCARREEQHRKMGKSSKVNITSLIAPHLC